MAVIVVDLTGLENLLLSQLLVTLITQLVPIGLLLIVFQWKGFKNFWNTRNDSSSAEPIPTEDEESSALSSSKKSTIFNIFKLKPSSNVLLMLILVVIAGTGLDLLDRTSSYALTFILELLGLSIETTSPYTQFLENDIDLLFLFISAVLIAPIFEELTFRGFLQQSLERGKYPDWVQYTLQGIGFALLHVPGDLMAGGSFDFVLTHIISTFSFAVVVTWLVKKYQSVLPAILTHFIGNFISMLILVYFVYLGHSSDYLTYLFVVCLIGLIFLTSLIMYWFGTHHQFQKPVVIKQSKGVSKGVLSHLLVFVSIMFLLQSPYLLITQALGDVGSSLLSLLLIGTIMVLLVFPGALLIFLAYKTIDVPWYET